MSQYGSKVFRISFSLLLTASLVLSACAPADAPASDEPVEITMWWWGEQDAPGAGEWIQDAINKYQAANPNVTITAVLQGTEETIPAFHAAAEAGEGPDIATLWYGGYMWEDVWAGNIAPLSDYIDEEEMSHWLGRKQSTFDGQVWASDLYGYSLLMTYNKEMFADAGLDPEVPPATWEEFLAACQALADAGYTPIGTGSLDGWLVVHLGAFFFYQSVGGVKGLAEAVTGDRDFTEPEYAYFWDLMEELLDKGYINYDAPSLTVFEGMGKFYSEEAAITFTTSTQAVAWMYEMGEDVVGVMAAPAVTDVPVDWVVTQGMTVFITEWSPNKEIAADFIKFLHSPEVLAASYDLLKGIVLPADDRFDTSVIEADMVMDIWELQESGFANNISFTDSVIPWGVLEDGLMKPISSMLSGGLTATEASAQTQAAAEIWRELNPEYLEKYKEWVAEQ